MQNMNMWNCHFNSKVLYGFKKNEIKYLADEMFIKHAKSAVTSTTFWLEQVQRYLFSSLTTFMIVKLTPSFDECKITFIREVPEWFFGGLQSKLDR